ncbi:hypothetical protein SUDANB95_05052 [Actinosynnema sp. ALI-1.44]
MKHTLMPWERGVHFSKGSVVGELGPGEHRLPRRDLVQRVDVRPRSHTPAWQDIPTADGVLVRVTLVITWSVADAKAFVLTAPNPEHELHLVFQLALRSAVLGRTHDQVDPDRDAIGAEVFAAVQARAAQLGVAVASVAVRDVVMPPELRKAALAEIVARAEAKAALERARGETAAMRSLLNAARLAEDHPALLRLRALQSAQTVVVEQPSS